MKRFLLTSAMVLMSASAAQALEVTNLDRVVHTVELSGHGAPQVRVIQPNATERFVAANYGYLSLKSAPVVKKGKGTLQSDGLLSGIIGAGRNQEIPIDVNSSYTIWPGGDLRLQSKRKYFEGR